MPPQQSHGLLDVFDQLFRFRAHGANLIPGKENERASRESAARSPVV